MFLNGREVKFLYSTWAYLEYNEFLVSHEQISAAKARVQLAIIMHKAYLDANGIKEKCISYDELKNMRYADLEELLREAEMQRAEDSRQTVEVKEKNGESAEKTV